MRRSPAWDAFSTKVASGGLVGDFLTGYQLATSRAREAQRQKELQQQLALKERGLKLKEQVDPMNAQSRALAAETGAGRLDLDKTKHANAPQEKELDYKRSTLLSMLSRAKDGQEAAEMLKRFSFENGLSVEDAMNIVKGGMQRRVNEAGQIQAARERERLRFLQMRPDKPKTTRYADTPEGRYDALMGSLIKNQPSAMSQTFMPEKVSGAFEQAQQEAAKKLYTDLYYELQGQGLSGEALTQELMRRFNAKTSGGQ